MDAKQARKLPHLNFSPQEWFFSTRFHSLAARGLLIDLASIQWMRGGFPNDKSAIERLVGVAIDALVWDEITPMLVPVGAGFGLRWIEDERSAAIARIERAAENGCKGAKTRYGKGSHSHPIATLEQETSHPMAISDCIGLDRTGLNWIEPETENTSCSIAPTRVAKPTRSKPKDTIAWTPEGGWQGITDADRAAWAKAYPACDIDRQLAAADQWLRANPTRAVKSAWRRFIVSWMSRSQDKGGDHRGTSNGFHPHTPKPTVDQKVAALADVLRNAPSRRITT